MLSFLAKKNNGMLGIDISSSSIKLLELSKSGSKYRVENYASRPLPDGAVVEKNIANLDAVGETMVKLASLVETTTVKAAVAVSGSAVITKSIEMNGSMSDTEMETQIALSKTPVLGDLPYIGNLFKRTESAETKTELLIFITPSIIKELM